MSSRKTFQVMFLTALLFLTACGAKQNTKLEISRAFAVTNGKFDGGLMVYGESASGKKVSLSIDSSYEKSVFLDDDVWTFYALGYDGSSKFTGTEYCGSTTQNIATSKSVDITVTTAGCDSTFKTAIGYQNVKFLSCATFHKYNPSGDAWTDLLNIDGDNNCSNAAPLGFKSPYKQFKITAIDMVGNNKLQVFESDCLNFDGSSSLNLPTLKFPFVVKGYLSAAECATPLSKHQKFEFPVGLSNGNPNDFDHLVHLQSGPVTRIVLPGSVSKRGKSPFMDMIPAIRCGTADCAPDLNESTHVRVGWSNGTYEDQTIKIGTTLTSCPTNVLGSSKYFGASNCSIDDKKITAKIERNELTCQTSGVFSSITDAVSRGGFYFILKSSPDTVDIYDGKGKRLTSYPLGSSGFNSIAARVSSNQLIFYVSQSSSVYKYTYSLSTNNVTSNGSQTLSGSVNDLDISDTEVLFYGQGTGTGTLGAWAWGAGSAISEFNPGTLGVTKVVYTPTNIYFLQDGYLRKKQWTGSAFTGVVTQYTPATSAGDLAVDANYIYLSSTTGSPGSVELVNISSFTSAGVSLSTTGVSGSSSNTPLVANGRLSIAGSANFDQWNLVTMPSPTLSSLLTNTSGICSEPVTIDGTALNFKAQAADDQFEIFRDAYELLGRTQFTSPNQAQYLIGNHEDDLDGGGKLRHAREHLSGAGVAGLIGDSYGSCLNIRDAVDTNAIVINKSVYDPFESKYKTAVITISDTTEVIHPFICVAGDPTGSTCGGATYDMVINFTLYEGTIIKEKMKAKIKCSSKLGVFEKYEIKDSSFSRNLISWNTGSNAVSRYESYEMDKQSSLEYSASVSKLEKTANNDWSVRKIQAQYMNGKVNASSIELEGESVNNTIMSLANNVQAVSWSDFNSNPSFTLSIQSTEFYGTAPALCMLKANTSIYATAQTGCAFAGRHNNVSISNNNALTLYLSMDNLGDLDQTTPLIKDFFSLN